MQDIMTFPRVQFSRFFLGNLPPDPLYNSCIRGWQSACFSDNLVLNVQSQKTPCQDKTNDDTRVWMKQKLEHQRIQNETKTLFTWSGGPRSSGVGFFCFHALGDAKQKKPTPTRPGSPTPCKQGLSSEFLRHVDVCNSFLTWKAKMGRRDEI